MRKRIAVGVFLIAAVILCFVGRAVPARAGSTDFTSLEDAADYVRAAMTDRQANISFTFLAPYAEVGGGSYAAVNEYINRFSDQLAALVFRHTGNPSEGDYLDAHRLGYGISAGYMLTGGKTDYLFTINMDVKYRTSAAQEKETDAAVRRILSLICPAGMDDAAKARAIYSYITNTVRYDYDGLEADEDPLIYSAYAALIRKTAVCEGYATLYYRMALEAGLDCRIIFGVSHDEPHAWNIVRVGSLYYNLDVTWDAGDGTWIWFLKGKSFPDHAMEIRFAEAPFTTQYPVADAAFAFPAGECAHRFADVEKLPAASPGTAERMLAICTVCGKAQIREADADEPLTDVTAPPPDEPELTTAAPETTTDKPESHTDETLPSGEKPETSTTLTPEPETTPGTTDQEGTTEKHDETSTKKPDETSTEKPDETSTEKPDETSTEKPDEATTEKPDEATMEKPDEATTEKPGETTTEKPADPPARRLRGDVSGNGKLEAGDARLALRAAVGLDPIEDGSPAFDAADVDGSNKIDAADARLILRKVVGFVDKEFVA